MHPSAEVVLETFRAVERRDRHKLFELYHDSVEFHEAASLPYGGSFSGKERLRRQLENRPEETWLGTWGALQPTETERNMDPRIVSAADREVVVSYLQRALSPDGERFEAPVLGIYEVRHGKLARAQMFHFDTAAILRFLERASLSSQGA